MHLEQRFAFTWQRWHASRALVLLPIGLITLITVVDIQTPETVHLGPLLVIAPAITVAFGGAWLTGLIGVLAVAAQVVIAVFHGGLTTANHICSVGRRTDQRRRHDHAARRHHRALSTQHRRRRQ
ncbi:hypothetical protein [Streptomyces spiralis]|nr:hypothetical protein [Streptomyces spiralis]